MFSTDLSPSTFETTKLYPTLLLPIDLDPAWQPPPSFNQNICHILTPLPQQLIRKDEHMRINVETKNVGFLRSLSPCSV